jgi:hypothetical protein
MDYFDSFDCQVQCEDFFDGFYYVGDDLYVDEDSEQYKHTANFDTPNEMFLDEF